MLKKTQHLLNDIFTGKDQLSPNRRLSVYLSGCILLLACGWKVYSGLQSAMDIQFADESAYMRFGLDLPGKMNRDWGPVYSIWYKCLSFITADTIQLYYLNFVVCSVLIGMLLYIFLLRIGVHGIFALLISFCILISDINISVWPRISHFCIVLCLLFLIVITYVRPVMYKFLLFAMLCLITSYARPEFYISFLLGMAATFIAVWYHRSTLKRKDYLYFAGTAVVIVALHLIFRFPSNDFFGYNRGVAAFYQHYAFNYKWRTHAPFDAWLYWEDLCKQTFGDCNSMWCVITTQPMIVLDNTLFNIKNYVISTFLHGYSYIFPIGLFHSKKIQLILVAGLCLLTILLLAGKDSRQRFMRQLHAFRFYVFILFLFIIPTVLSCVVVFPRDHYVYLQMPFLLLILISIFHSLFDTISLKPLAAILFGVLLFLATPNISSYSFLKGNNEINNSCNKQLVRYLSKNYSNQPHTLFTNIPFLRGMLPENFKEVNTIFNKKKNTPFSHYLDSAAIDIIVIIPSTFRDPHITSDSSWNDFIRHYERFNFRKEELHECATYLLVKQR